MSRMLAAACALLTLGTPALAADGPSQVCLLRSSQTITGPKKPDIFQTELDCGAKPTAEQDRLSRLVHNAMDTADALELALQHGYVVADASWRDSYTGRQILGVYTLVSGAPAAARPAGHDDAELADDDDDLAVPAIVDDEGPADEGSDDDDALEAVDDLD